MAAPALTTKGQTTRAAILKEARAALVLHGGDGVVMRDIAKCCGIQLGNLQYYFPSRDALILQIIEEEAARDYETVMQLAEGEPNAERGFRLIITELVNRWRQDSAPIYAVLNLRALHSKAFQSLYQEIYARYYGALEHALKRLRPDLSKKERAMRARLLSALIDGAAYQTQTRPHAKFLDRVIAQACRIAL